MFLCYGTGKWRLTYEHMLVHAGTEIREEMLTFLRSGIPVYVEYLPRQYSPLYNEYEVSLACRMVMSVHQYWDSHSLPVATIPESDLWNFAVFTTVPVPVVKNEF